MKKHLLFVCAAALLLMPVAVFASVTLTATAPYPGATVNAGTRVSFLVIASGFDHPTYTVVDSFGGGANSSNIDSSGNFFWNSNISEVGTHTITITANDTSGNTASVVQTIVVNSGPTASVSGGPSFVTVGNPVSFSVTPSGLFSPTYSAADSFADSSLQSGAVNSNGAFNWTPLPQDVGAHTITITTKDGMGYSATTSQTVTVLPIPTMTINNLSPGYTVKAGQTVSFIATTTGLITPSYTITDTFNGTTATSTATVSAAGRVVWTPQPNDVGVHTFIVTASDSNGRSLVATIAIMVQVGLYTAPAATAAPATTTPAAATTGSSTATAAHTFTKYLQVGSTGSDVTALQQLLIVGGFLKTTASGYFGVLTKAAVQAYQSAHGVQPLGVVGPATRAVLNKR